MGKYLNVRKTSKELYSTLYLGQTRDIAAHGHDYKYHCIQRSSLIEKNPDKSEINGLIDCLISLFCSYLLGERGRQKTSEF